VENNLHQPSFVFGIVKKSRRGYHGLMKCTEDTQILQAFVDHLEKWGCQVLRAVNRSNPYRGGFSILFRCDAAIARAIAALGIAQILLDVRADTYLLRLPEVNIDASPEPHPAILSWNEVTKQQKLEELLALWENSGDILEKRRKKLGMFYRE